MLVYARMIQRTKLGANWKTPTNICPNNVNFLKFIPSFLWTYPQHSSLRVCLKKNFLDFNKKVIVKLIKNNINLIISANNEK